jgi:2-isopropylmalate synthase
MQLVDYKVRVINSSEGTAARVRVVIESRDAQDVWSTVGVGENVIEASWWRWWTASVQAAEG